ncbi:LacI family transcriptional regulator [Rhizobium sp. LEGMi198b]
MKRKKRIKKGPTSQTDAPEQRSERPTLKSLAFMTGLGVSTVSRALQDGPEISLQTKKRVQLAAEHVGYRPNRAGVRLRTGRTGQIVLVLNTDEQVGGFVSEMIYGISEYLAETPYHLTVSPYSRNQDPMDPIRYIVETNSADGIIISWTEPNDLRVRYMAEHSFPFATHGRTSTGIDHPYHDYDNFVFSDLGVRKLAELGRDRLMLLAPPPSMSYHYHMRDGFLDAVLKAGGVHVPFNTVTVHDPINRIRESVAELMASPLRPNGVISASDAATFALVAGIEDAGLRLGRDIDVVSKQSSQLLHLFRNELYVINEDVRLAGYEVAKAVIGNIGGVELPALQTIATPSLVEAATALKSQM